MAATDAASPAPAIEIHERTAQPTAGVRDRVPVAGLEDFFARAFEETMALLRASGQAPTGAPFGKYYSEPGETIDVEAGFPVDAPITAAGRVVPGVLPGGTVVETVHVGPYDTMHRTYRELQRFLVASGLTPGRVVWESYLSDPAVEPDAAAWRTRISWPVEPP